MSSNLDSRVERRLRLALAAGRMGTWEWDLDSGAAAWDEQLEALCGLAPGTFGGSFDDWARLVHPDDLDQVVQSLTRAIEFVEPFRFDFRTVWPDGSIHWLEGIGELTVVDGRAAGAVGVTQNIDARVDAQQSEREARVRAEAAAAMLERFHTLADETPSTVALDELLVTLPPLIADLMSVDTVRILLITEDGSSLEVRGATGFHGTYEDVLVPVGRGVVGRVVESRQPVVELDVSQSDVHSAALRAEVASLVGVPLLADDRCVGVLDVGARNRREFSDDEIVLLRVAAERVARAIERTRLAALELRAQERFEFLTEINHTLNDKISVVESMRAVVNGIVPRLADWCALVLFGVEAEDAVWEVAHRDPDKTELVRRLQADYPIDPDDAVRIPDQVRGGETRVYPVIDSDLIDAASDDPVRTALLRELSPYSAMVVPIRGPHHVIGVLQLVRSHPDHPYSAWDVELADELVDRIGSSLSVAQLFEAQRNIARTLQTSLLPTSLPSIPGLDVAVRYWTPAGTAEVGGDFYDVFPIDPDTWGLTIGDISGKGIGAAALTGVARQTMRAAARHGRSPGEVLTWLHDALLDQAKEFNGQSCTAICGVLRRGPGGFTLRLALGGHPQPVHLPENGPPVLIGEYGSVLGLLANPTFHETTVDLRFGDQVVLYTDGVTDVPGASALGDDELLEFVAGAAGGSAGEMAERLGAAIDTRHASVTQRDDTALLVLRVIDSTGRERLRSPE